MKIGLVGIDWDIVDLIESIPELEIIGFFAPEGACCAAFPYLGSDEDWEAAHKLIDGLKIVLSLDIPSMRETLFQHYGKTSILSLQHPNAYISKHATLSQGCIIQRGVTIMPHAKLGMGCKVNVNVTIHHDSQIGNFCTIAPGALILGNVVIECGAYIGAGAIIKQRCRVGKGAVIGAGAVVVKDIPPEKTYVGIPAREQQKSSV